MFDHYSEVPDSGPHPFATWIPIILEKKQPRRFLVQAHTELKGRYSVQSDGKSTVTALLKLGGNLRMLSLLIMISKKLHLVGGFGASGSVFY